jgi:hypothetical protein
MVLGFVTFLLIGCKKDTTTNLEKPITALFADNTISDANFDTVYINDFYYEFGFEFEVTKNGKVTQLGTHIPDTDDVRVSLWDLSDTSVIAQSTISVLANTPKFVNLATSVSLTTSKKYAITMQSNDYYYKQRTSTVVYSYPITKGNIKITKYGFNSGLNTSAKYPNIFATNYLAGVVDFTYETEN